MGLVGLLLIGGLYLIRPKPARVRAPAQPFLIVESKTPLAQAPAPAPKSEEGTTIPEVRAALEAALAEKPRPPVKQPPARSTPRTDPRREVALSRVKAALPEAKEAEKAPPPAPSPAKVEAPPPPPPMARPRPARKPSSPTIVEIRPDEEKGATKFFAAALRSQRTGQLDRAVEEYQKSIAADPRNPAAFNNLGVALKESGRLDQAIEAFEQALALDPKYEKALNNLGVIRYRKGQYREAIDLFKQALRINPANVESHTNLGIIFLLAERHNDALEAFGEALRYDPTLAEAHYNVALLWERRGHREKAERHYQKFVELASERHAPLVAKVRERLRFLARGR
ncbi:MAG: tetratricopeptide repeat protein [Candidatus Methylomirabilia bacterium]